MEKKTRDSGLFGCNREIILEHSMVQQQNRVPAVAIQGTTPIPPLAIQMADLGGPQECTRLGTSSATETERKRLISKAEKQKDDENTTEGRSK